MRHHNRFYTAILCTGLMSLAACDGSSTPVAPQPGDGSARLAAVPSGLAAFYSFDQNAGNGTVAGATHRATGGYQGGGYYFDGQGAYITLPVDVNPSKMAQATMGAWARTESVTSVRRAQVLSHDNGAFDRSIGLEPNVDGRHRFSSFIGAGGAGVLTGSAANLSRWVFVAAVYDAGTVTLYVDGAQYSTTGTPGAGVSSLRVGGNPAGSISGEPFHGSIDNVFVYNRALSATEIEAIRTGGACAIVSPCIGVPGAGEVRDGLTGIADLVSVAGTAGELRTAQARHLSRLIVLATGYLDQADRTASPQRQAGMLRYVLVELDEALGLLRGSGSATTAARDETVRVRGLVQARLSAI
jgi:hypothetical protein